MTQPTRHRPAFPFARIRLAPSLLALLMAFSPTDHNAAAEPAMPLEIEERLWRTPGPVRDAPDAPRLLIVYPRERGDGRADDETVVEGNAMRYAGRVEPTTAAVTLNGDPLRVWPGGVFTGTLPVDAGTSATWVFVSRDAAAGDATTIVARRVRRDAPPPPPPRRPLAVAADPVSPTGDHWLPPDGKLRVTLWASADARAVVRVGESGEWQPMQPGRADARRGTPYVAELVPPATRDNQPAAVELRLDAPDAPAMLNVHPRPRLRLGRLPAEPRLGRIDKNFGTFLKNPDGWMRWGNWIEGTPFPILEVRGDRIRTAFGGETGIGTDGWIETESAKIAWDQPYGDPPRLDAPTVDPDRSRLTLRWAARKSPVAAVFEHEPRADGDRLTIRFPGANALPAKTFALRRDRPIASLIARDAANGQPPQLQIAFKPGETLWGFGMRADPLRIDVRARPRLSASTPAAPLKGLKVMIDAGHGGSDFGALGPSGVAESDLNLVQAAWLERELAALGATIRQIRRDDRSIGLDPRVDLALDWEPDLFVSLHHNSVPFSSDPLADRGPKVFYHYPPSQPLARAIADKLAAVWPGATARIEEANFRVNRNIGICPSALVETAFVCNPEDESRLRDGEALKSTAKAIAEGIVSQFLGN